MGSGEERPNSFLLWKYVVGDGVKELLELWCQVFNFDGPFSFVLTTELMVLKANLKI